MLLLLLQSCASRESCCHNCGLRRARCLPPAAPAGDEALQPQPHAGAVPGTVVHLAEDVTAGYVAACLAAVLAVGLPDAHLRKMKLAES